MPREEPAGRGAESQGTGETAGVTAAGEAGESAEPHDPGDTTGSAGRAGEAGESAEPHDPGDTARSARGAGQADESAEPGDTTGSAGRAGQAGESADPGDTTGSARGAGEGGLIGESPEVYDERQIVRISASSAVVGVAIVVLALLAQRVFVAAHRPLSWAVAAVVVAILIDPLVGLVGRHFPRIPRVVAVLGALLLVAVAAFGMVYRAFDDLSEGLDRLGDAAMDAADQVEDRDDGVGQLARDVDASRRVDDFVEAVEGRVTGGEDVLASTAGTAPTYFIGAIFTVFLMSYGPRLARSALLQIPDGGRRERVAGVVGRALVRGRRAVLFTLGEGLLAGLAVGLTAAAFGLPAPSALGLTAGLVSLLPHVGLLLGGLPFLLLMLGLRSDAATIAVAVVMVACQLLDSLVVRPWIADRSVHIGLLVPWLVTLIGYRVYGVGGAAYSLAFAAFGLAAIDEIEWRAQARRDEAGAADGGAVDGAEVAGAGGGGPAELPPAEQPVSG